MYTVAIKHPDKPLDRRTCTTGGDLRNAAYELIRSQGTVIADADHSGLIALIGDARSTAELEGFAALTFGDAWMTIRPATTPAA
jgi:hypothetical protein